MIDYTVQIDEDNIIDQLDTDDMIYEIEKRGNTVFTRGSALTIDITGMSLAVVNNIKEVLDKNNITYEG